MLILGESGWNIWEIPVLPAQFCCETKTALKIEVYYNNQKKKRLVTRQDTTERVWENYAVCISGICPCAGFGALRMRLCVIWSKRSCWKIQITQCRRAGDADTQPAQAFLTSKASMVPKPLNLLPKSMAWSRTNLKWQSIEHIISAWARRGNYLERPWNEPGLKSAFQSQPFSRLIKSFTIRSVSHARLWFRPWEYMTILTLYLYCALQLENLLSPY